MVTQRTYTERLICSKKIKRLITHDCVQEFKRNHPALKEHHVTHNMILTAMTRYYLQREIDDENDIDK